EDDRQGKSAEDPGGMGVVVILVKSVEPRVEGRHAGSKSDREFVHVRPRGVVDCLPAGDERDSERSQRGPDGESSVDGERGGEAGSTPVSFERGDNRAATGLRA